MYKHKVAYFDKYDVEKYKSELNQCDKPPFTASSYNKRWVITVITIMVSMMKIMVIMPTTAHENKRLLVDIFYWGEEEEKGGS